MTYLDDVVFDYKQFGEDDEQLQNTNPIVYCIKQCHKIGYYMQKVQLVDIIRMDVEFIKDDFGEIFFFHATNIWTRQNQLLTGMLVSQGEKVTSKMHQEIKDMSKEPSKRSWIGEKGERDAQRREQRKMVKSSMGFGLCQPKLE